MTKRDELLNMLALFTHAPGRSLDRESGHLDAEDLLLELLGDKEVTEAWESARDEWWYA